MGIYDREYYRGETVGSGLFGSISPVCNALILINVVVFVLRAILHSPAEERFVHDWLAVSPNEIWHHGKIWQLLTATFLHDQARIWHILGNMCFLWFIGREIEALYGGRDFLAFYLVAAITSSLFWVLCNTVRPEDRDHYMIGASGAVTAVVVLFALYYPHRQVLLFFILPIPIWVLVVIYLFFPFLNRGGLDESHVAIESHLAGAAFAVAFKHFDLKWSRLVSRRLFSRPRLRIFSPIPHEKPRARTLSPSYTTSPGAAANKTASTGIVPEEQLNAQLDEVLAKIAREGRDGLTEQENWVLLEASRRARIKRSDRS